MSYNCRSSFKLYVLIRVVGVALDPLEGIESDVTQLKAQITVRAEDTGDPVLTILLRGP